MDELRSVGSRATLKDLVDAYERHVIEDALRAASGNQRRAAHALGRPAHHPAREDEAAGAAAPRGAGAWLPMALAG